MTNALYDLYQSTVALHERFNTNQTVQQSLNRFTEEYNEVLDAVTKNDLENTKEEFIDCLVTAIGVFVSIGKSDSNINNFKAFFILLKGFQELYLVIRKAGVTSEMLEEPINKVIRKNNAKTLETHELNATTGKITRKVIQ